jgi:hypothetical protein
MTPNEALRVVEHAVPPAMRESAQVEEAIDRLWELVLLGK